MRLLSALVIVALFVFLAGLSFGWWTPDADGVGVAYLFAAVLIVVDLLFPEVAARRRQPPPA
jgi:hypothetical protein